MSISSRLKEERERLNLNQSEFGALAGVTRKTQFNYETGERSPDSDYLAAVATAGVDVRYVVTGQRLGTDAPASLQTMQPAEQAAPSAAEAAILDRYRALDATTRRQLARFFAVDEVPPVQAPVVEAARVEPKQTDAELWRMIATGLPTTPGVNPNTRVSLAEFVEMVNTAFAFAKGRLAEEAAKAEAIKGRQPAQASQSQSQSSSGGRVSRA